MGYGCFGIGIQSLPVGFGTEGFVVSFCEGPADTIGQIFSRFVSGDIAVVQVVDHLRNTAHIESYAGNTAGHGFHDGVRQVVLQGRSHVKVDCVVNVHQFLFVAHIIHVVDREGEQGCTLFGTASQHDDSQLAAEFGFFLCQQLTGFDEVGDSFPFVSDLHGAEQQQFLVGRQMKAFTGSCLGARTEQIGVDGIGNIGNGVSREQGTFACHRFQPPAAGHKRNM